MFSNSTSHFSQTILKNPLIIKQQCKSIKKSESSNILSPASSSIKECQQMKPDGKKSNQIIRKSMVRDQTITSMCYSE